MVTSKQWKINQRKCGRMSKEGKEGGWKLVIEDHLINLSRSNDPTLIQLGEQNYAKLMKNDDTRLTHLWSCLTRPLSPSRAQGSMYAIILQNCNSKVTLAKKKSPLLRLLCGCPRTFLINLSLCHNELALEMCLSVNNLRASDIDWSWPSSTPPLTASASAARSNSGS